MTLPTATEVILERTVRYYAVDKGGRRCEVTRESVEAHHQKWAADGWTIETDVQARNVPGYGKVRLV